MAIVVVRSGNKWHEHRDFACAVFQYLGLLAQRHEVLAGLCSACFGPPTESDFAGAAAVAFKHNPRGADLLARSERIFCKTDRAMRFANALGFALLCFRR